MNGRIVNFRGGRHTQKNNQMVVSVADDKEKAKALIGKHVIWKSPAGKELKGKIDLEVGYATYPDDARNSADLLKKIKTVYRCTLGSLV